MDGPSKCSFRARVAFSIIGLLVGVSIAIVFSAQYQNYSTALWGLASGIGALITLCVHIMYSRGFWEVYPFRLKSLMLLGCFIQLAGVCGFVVYLALAITKHQDLTAYGDGYYLTSVWCFMTWKWGFLLLYYSRDYKRIYLSESLLLHTKYEKGTIVP